MWRQDQHLGVNPTDVLEAEALIDAMMDKLTALRRGRKSLRRSYTTTCAGLQTMVAACSSLYRLTGECWDLLLYMERQDGAVGTETETRPSPVSTISQETLSETDGGPCVDICRSWSTRGAATCPGCDYREPVPD